MRQFINAETREPLDPQVAYMDGYAIAERILEDVLFEIRIEKGQLVCDGVRQEDRHFYNDMGSAKTHLEWQEQVVQYIEETGGDTLVTAEGEDVEYLTAHPRPPRTYIPIDIPKVDIDEVIGKAMWNDIIGLTVEEALPLVKDRGINSIRPTIVDGQPQMVTFDMRGDRLNVSTDGGKITSVSKVG